MTTPQYPEPQYPGQDPQYPGPNPQYPGQQPQYPGQPQYAGQQPQYPGQPQYAGQNVAYGGPNPQYPGAYGVSDKSKLVAGILGILLGGFGAGRFYMGDIKTGVLQLVVSLVTCGLGGLWGLIDGILILVNGGVDGEGRPLRD